MVVKKQTSGESGSVKFKPNTTVSAPTQSQQTKSALSQPSSGPSSSIALGKNEMVLLALAVILLGVVAYFAFIAPQAQQSALAGNETISAPVNVVKTPITPVYITVIKDSVCNDCQGADYLVTALANNAALLEIEIANVDSVYSTDEKGVELIQKYSITRVPTLIITGKLSEDSKLVSSWVNFGTRESDGTLVFRSPYPPYLDLDSKEIVGGVSIIELVDATCADCYNVSLHQDLLKTKFAMRLSGVTTFDISSENGKALISKYKITKVPTVILSNAASAYPNFDEIWLQVGSIESDGSLVFRAVEQITSGSYKDLSVGSESSAAAASTSSAATSNGTTNTSTSGSSVIPSSATTTKTKAPIIGTQTKPPMPPQ